MSLLDAMARAHYEKYFEEVADLHLKWHDQPSSHLERLYEALRAALAEARKQGWKLVPVEPTEAMIAAAQGRDEHRLDDDYYLMISASPSIDEV